MKCGYGTFNEAAAAILVVILDFTMILYILYTGKVFQMIL